MIILTSPSFSIRRPMACLALLACLVLAVPVAAQDRSSTGRHKPEPVVVEETTEEEKPAARSHGRERRWHFGLDGGVQGGGDLFRIETADGSSIGWEMGNGKYFNASRFTATLDQDFVLNFHAIRDLNAIWSIRGDVSWSNMDVAAEALSGQIGVLYQFDRFSVINLGLGMEARLVKVPSHPFINFQVLVSRLSPETNTELEQTNLGGRLGLGYNKVITPEVSLRLELRYSLTAFSVGDYVPSSNLPTDPEVIYDPQDNLNFFELLLGVQGNF